MTVMEYVDGECEYKTGDLSEAVALECLKLHMGHYPQTRHDPAPALQNLIIQMALMWLPDQIW